MPGSLRNTWNLSARKSGASRGLELVAPPPLAPGLFDQDAHTIADELAAVATSRQGLAFGMRMLTYYIHREGERLPQDRRAELERAKRILNKKIVKLNREEDDRQQRAS